MSHPCRPYLPPEWAPQSATMLTWPRADSPWGKDLAQVEAVFVQLARHISSYQKLLLVCADAAHETHIRNLLLAADTDIDTVVFAMAAADDSWARDHGPLTVLCQQQAQLMDFRFDGWGGKYPADKDNSITRTLFGAGVFGGPDDDIPLESVDLVVEGGAIEVDGSGTLLATASSLLPPQRNRGCEPADIERQLMELLGLTRILWLHQGHLTGDDTDGHIDTLARFCDTHTIAYSSCDDPQDEHYAPLTAMAQELRALRTLDNRPYTLVPLPLPQAIYDKQGQRLPASYANFLIINGAVLLPAYNDAADDLALSRLQSCFPGRKIIPIDCLPLIHQYGSLHCITMQLPAGVIA